MAQTMRDPPSKCWAATKSDTVNEARTFRCLMTDTTGNVKVTTVEGDDVVLYAAAAGIWHPILAKRVWSTGTTGTNILLGA